MPRLRPAEPENDAIIARFHEAPLARRLVLSAMSVFLAPSIACTPTADSAASSATHPSAWSSSDTPPTSSTNQAPPSLPPTRFELAARLPTLRKAVPRLRSQHLTGDHDAEILASEEASAYPTLGPSRALGEGATLVEAIYPAESQEVAVYFVMLKQPEGSAAPWEYLVVSPDGRIQQRGALPLCDRCHAEAPHDRVFGRPRP